jgi:UDP-N-acetylglucosamine transferase subunit ALG13
MGSILSALSLGKPLLILPRREDLGEHRNDHQRATAGWVAGRRGVFVAADEAELPGLLDELSDDARGRAAGSLSPFAETRLIEVIGAFIRGDDGERPNER